VTPCVGMYVCMHACVHIKVYRLRRQREVVYSRVTWTEGDREVQGWVDRGEGDRTARG